MTYQGTVQHGVIVLAAGQVLPEGMQVEIVAQMTDDRSSVPAKEPTIWQKLVQLAEEVESIPCDLPEDLAANHDHYLYGLPKRE